jgi:selenium metabolism protein YedF
MLDCKGLACPQPVMRTKELIENQAPETVQVLVDNKAASDNVSRFLASQGYEAQVGEEGGDFLVSAKRDPNKAASPPPPEVFTCDPEDQKVLVFIRAATMGRGDDQLGAGLMKAFISTLTEMGPALWRLMFVNSGVKLACQGSEALPALQELEAAGVSILVCGTCLTHFDLLESKQVGETTNMLDIVTSLQVAGKVITV